MNTNYKKESTFKSITRGGQLLLHELHMIGQVLCKVLLWLLPVGLLATIGWFVLTTEAYLRYLGKQWLWANCYVFFDNQKHQQLFMLPDGHTIQVYSAQLIATPFIHETLTVLRNKLEHSFWVGLVIYVITVIGVVIWLYRRGGKEGAQKHVNGDYLGSVNEVKKMIRENKQSDLIIGIEKLPLPRFSEVQHFFFHGTTGSGKSTAIKAFLDYIRARGEKAILYDKGCNLIEEFYLAEMDFMMNALDERSVNWNLWLECHDKADFDNLAAALMPMPPSTQDPFWINAARTIFAAAAHRMRKDTSDKNSLPKILPLLRYLLTADIGELQALLKGTEAESLMSEKTEKTAISIKSVLATYLKSLCYIKEGDQPFSIRQWIQNDKSPSWLFMSSLGNKNESLKPLITAWLDIAVNELISLPPDSKRRIWIILDELASVQQLPYLTPALAEARKFGGCFIIGIQSYADLSKIYGKDGATAISSLLNTRFMFRNPDPDMAKWSAQNLGETTVEEVKEGISYGANSIRDGVSIQREERQKPVVSYSEILRLNNLSCYVRLPGEYPITKLHFPYIERPKINEPFKERAQKQDGLRDEVLKLADNLKTTSADISQDSNSSANNQKPRANVKKNKKKKEIQIYD